MASSPVLAEGNTGGLGYPEGPNPWWKMRAVRRAMARNSGNAGQGHYQDKEWFENMARLMTHEGKIKDELAKASAEREQSKMTHAAQLEYEVMHNKTTRDTQAQREQLGMLGDVFGGGGDEEVPVDAGGTANERRDAAEEESNARQQARSGGIAFPHEDYGFKVRTMNGGEISYQGKRIRGDALSGGGGRPVPATPVPEGDPREPGFASKFVHPYQESIINDPKLVREGLKAGKIDKETAEIYMEEMRANKTDAHGVVKSGPLFKPYTRQNKETGKMERTPEFQTYLQESAEKSAAGGVAAGRKSKRGNVVGREVFEANLEANRNPKTGSIEASSQTPVNPNLGVVPDAPKPKTK